MQQQTRGLGAPSDNMMVSTDQATAAAKALVAQGSPERLSLQQAAARSLQARASKNGIASLTCFAAEPTAAIVWGDQPQSGGLWEQSLG